jgi:hypothetical protein
MQQACPEEDTAAVEHQANHWMADGLAIVLSGACLVLLALLGARINPWWDSEAFTWQLVKMDSPSMMGGIANDRCTTG